MQLKCLLDSLMYEQHADALEPSPHYTNGRERWMPGATTQEEVGVSDIAKATVDVR